MHVLTNGEIDRFEAHLRREEKSDATIEKYLRDVRRFLEYSRGHRVSKETVVAYKRQLQEDGYAVRSINSMLASLNSLLSFLGWQDMRAKGLRQQRRTYAPEERELTKGEYMRLLKAAGCRHQLGLIMQTLCATGIRVSELRYFTAEAIRYGEVVISCKNKTRTILIPGKLRKLLLNHARSCGIEQGPVFRGLSGCPLDRSRIWQMMKRLCASAGVDPQKVFPHNLRKLFARTFYSQEKDIAKLADILGHSSIDTTRIYIMTTGSEHRRKMERLGLVI